MKRNRAEKLVRILMLALLLSLLGALLLGAYASGLEGDLDSPSSSTCAPNRILAGDQACYTLDTSRPEWLGGWTVVYLPVILKADSP